MQVRWSALAADDLERICSWVEKDNPEAARRIAKTIYHGCSHLAQFPNTGRLSHRMSGRRELAFPPLPYVVIYQVKEHLIEISRVFHSAQDWP